jgi:type I restriction enzyme R subunit
VSKNSLSEQDLEDALRPLVEEMGWSWANCYHEKLGDHGDYGRDNREVWYLPKALRAALERLNPELPKSSIDEAFEAITRDRSTLSLVRANRDLHEMLRDGVEVKVPLDDGGSETARAKVIDWSRPAPEAGANEYLFAQQFWISGELYNSRTDLLGFVNGLPLVFLELKKPDVSVKHAFDDNFRSYKQSCPHLFWANGVVLLSNGIDTKVGSLTGAWEHFKDWKRIEREDEEPTVSIETALRGVCEPSRLLDIVENFTLFSEQKSDIAKIVGQNHQFLGVNNALQAVERIKENQGKLGVFWHTQGSGKSFSMVFFSQKILRKVPGDWTFLILTDRTDLDDQIYRTFVGCGAVKVAKGSQSKDARRKGGKGVQATSGEHLQTLLTQNHRYVFTLIQKFQLDKDARERGDQYPELSDRSNIIVIADEAHRSQYDTFARNLRRALPNAAFIGFTGTPLMAGEEETKETFGDYVSVYNFRQAIQDNATVPLYYENRIPELQLSNEDLSEQLADVVENADLDEEQAVAVEREFGRQYHLITRDERLDKVAEDLVDHYMGLKSRGKAMMIAIDKVTAVRMYDKVQEAWKAKIVKLDTKRAKLLGSTDASELAEREELDADLAFMRETDMAVVVSSGQNEIEDFKKKGLDIKHHRSRMVRTDIDTHFKDDQNPLRIVFVCAMWLTGFDVPSCSTIYLDKPMRNHTLMQTIARANRVYPGKLNGLIVDYVGVFRNLQKALAIYGGASGGGVKAGDSPVEPKEAQLEELRERIVQAKEFCKEHGVDLDTLRDGKVLERVDKLGKAREALLFPDEVRRKYLAVASRIDRLFKAIGLDEQIEEFVKDRNTIHKLADTIRAATDPPDISAVMAEVEELLDASIGPKGYVIREPKDISLKDDSGLPYRPDHRIDLGRIDFDALAAFFEKNQQPRATIAALQKTAKKKLEELVRNNPTRRDLYDKLEELIDDYNEGSHNVQESFEAIKSFIQGLSEEEARHVKEGCSEEELAIFDILTKPGVELTKPERKQVKDMAKDLLNKLKTDKFTLDWKKSARGRARVRTAILDALEELPEAYSDDLFDAKCEAVYEHVYESYHGDGASTYRSGPPT